MIKFNRFNCHTNYTIFTRFILKTIKIPKPTVNIFKAPKMAVDFGTANCVIILEGKGVVVNEPTVVAVSPKEKKVVAIGEEAKKMLGKVPVGLEAKRPLKNGGIANYRLAEALLNRFFKKALGRVRFLKPEVIISVPAGLTSVEERAVIQALNSVGAGKIFLFPEPIAASIGAKLPINESSGNMIVNLGGGTAEIAVLSLNGIVTYSSYRGAGDALNNAITAYLKSHRGLVIGEQTAERIKINLASAVIPKHPKEMEVRGRNIKTGLPDTITVTNVELVDSIRPVLNEIVDVIKRVLDKTPPELISDIYDRGMVLSGGTSLLDGLDQLITNSIGIPAHVVEEPLLCVARGLEIALNNIDQFKRSVKRG